MMNNNYCQMRPELGQSIEENELYDALRAMLEGIIAPKSMFYTVKETSDIIKCGKTKTFALIKENRLQKVKMGSKTLVTKSSVDALIAELMGQQGGGHAA